LTRAEPGVKRCSKAAATQLDSSAASGRGKRDLVEQMGYTQVINVRSGITRRIADDKPVKRLSIPDKIHRKYENQL